MGLEVYLKWWGISGLDSRLFPFVNIWRFWNLGVGFLRRGRIERQILFYAGAAWNLFILNLFSTLSLCVCCSSAWNTRYDMMHCLVTSFSKASVSVRLPPSHALCFILHCCAWHLSCAIVLGSSYVLIRFYWLVPERFLSLGSLTVHTKQHIVGSHTCRVNEWQVGWWWFLGCTEDYGSIFVAKGWLWL